MTQGTVQLIAGILCMVLIAVIIYRRKSKKKSAEDEF
jgi:LPXTG-motif cell wall-anchored protein